MEKFKKTLSNYIWLPILLTIGFIGWVCKIDFVTVPLLCVYVGLLLGFCDDIRNLYPVAFAVPFFINTIEGFMDYVILGIGIAFFIVGLIIFLIRHLAIKKTPVKKGKLFWGMVACLVAYLIGGIVGYFNILNALIITAMTCASYLLYWLAINFTHSLKTYLNYLFISIGIILSIQLLISYVMVDEPFLSAILSKNVIWIGLQNINVVAIYFMLAMLSTFQLALGHKLDYLITLSGLFFAICTYFTYSRMGMLICAILLIIATIFLFVKSKNKTAFLIMLISITLALLSLFIFGFETLTKILKHYTKLGFDGNGRDELWPWCWEKFLDNPAFGIGFTTNETIPGLPPTKIILAHNSLLQYLVSLGVIGTIIISFFFLCKYKILCTKFNNFKFMNLLTVMAIALSGITDQSPTGDVFIICITLILIANAEKDTEITTPTQANSNKNQLQAAIQSKTPPTQKNSSSSNNTNTNKQSTKTKNIRQTLKQKDTIN